MLDNLRTNHTSETGIPKWQRKTRAVQQGCSKSASIPELTKENINCNTSGRQCANDTTRTTTDIQYRTFLADELDNVLEALTLPVTLGYDNTVVGAVIIVGTENRVPQAIHS